MTLQRPRAVPLPAESGLAPLFAGADLADAYAIALPPDAPADVEVLARCALGGFAPWARALLRLRDRLMAPLGVKTSAAIRDAAAAGNVALVGFFPVRWRDGAELVLGADDSHLDFHTSVLRRSATGGAGRGELVLTTVVHCHNPLGRGYLAAITPFHKAIARSCLARAARDGWQPPDARAGGARARDRQETEMPIFPGVPPR